MSNQDNTKDFCPHCNEPSQKIQVHGQLQCSHCGKQIEGCCGGVCCDLADPEE